MSRAQRIFFAVGVFVFCAAIGTALLGSAVSAGDKKGKVRREIQSDSSAALSAPQGGLATPLINEVDADQTGTDSASFIEVIFNPQVSLNGYVLVLYNGNGDTSYLAIDLDGLTTDAFGIATVGNAGVPGVDLTVAGDFIQNGPDAIGLYTGDAANFPNGTALTTANLIDAVVYDTADPDDTGLLTLLSPGPGQMQVDETGGSNPTLNSIQRCVNLARDWRQHVVRVPSPDQTNVGCQSRNEPYADIDGDGRSDYLIVRADAGGAAAATDLSGSSSTKLRLSTRERLRMRAEALRTGSSLATAGGTSLRWWGLNSSNFSVSTAEWGVFPGDDPLTADFDGDGKDDFTVWRPGVEGSYWYSIDSSTFTARQVHFGGPADNPFVVGDYDGDGIDDPAVFRCPDVNPGPCYFFYRPSSIPNPGDWAVEWGSGLSGDVRPYPGDFNGDGKNDFAVHQQSPTTPGNGVFYVTLNGTFEFSAVEWGDWFDFLIPGDFDGDGKSDFTVTRIDQNDVLWWYVLEQDGGMRFVPWGRGGDLEVPGDYDGDGKDDFAIYRDNTTDSTYWILPSSGDSHFAVTWGQPLDIPVQNVFVQ